MAEHSRGGRWVINLDDRDAGYHLFRLGLNQDTQLIMRYFTYLLFEETANLGTNEFSERHQDIKDGILSIMNSRYDTGSRQLGPVIEGIIRKSLLNDGCVDNSTPYPNWTGNFHEHPNPRNFYQFLEGALADPRSRIGRTMDYPPDEEIYYISEMIRNPLSHGVQTAANLEDFIVLFFVLILLYHDLVNPHNYPGDDKYLKWVNKTSRTLRLGGKEANLDTLKAVATEQGLDLVKVEAGYNQTRAR